MGGRRQGIRRTGVRRLARSVALGTLVLAATPLVTTLALLPSPTEAAEREAYVLVVFTPSFADPRYRSMRDSFTAIEALWRASGAMFVGFAANGETDAIGGALPDGMSPRSLEHARTEGEFQVLLLSRGWRVLHSSTGEVHRAVLLAEMEMADDRPAAVSAEHQGAGASGSRIASAPRAVPVPLMRPEPSAIAAVPSASDARETRPSRPSLGSLRERSTDERHDKKRFAGAADGETPRRVGTQSVRVVGTGDAAASEPSSVAPVARQEFPNTVLSEPRTPEAKRDPWAKWLGRDEPEDAAQTAPPTVPPDPIETAAVDPLAPVEPFDARTADRASVDLAPIGRGRPSEGKQTIRGASLGSGLGSGLGQAAPDAGTSQAYKVAASLGGADWRLKLHNASEFEGRTRPEEVAPTDKIVPTNEVEFGRTGTESAVPVPSTAPRRDPPLASPRDVASFAPIALPPSSFALEAELPPSAIERAKSGALEARFAAARRVDGFEAGQLDPALPLGTVAKMRFEHGPPLDTLDRLSIGPMLLVTGSCGALPPYVEGERYVPPPPKRGFFARMFGG